ncbi:cell division protein ZapA [Sphingomicrobium clamense]|uniref:Cell division protein ZapA n=1 Tax=Sphingomicrobium clamense TaxID=2851013 RepID=A0ABS6V5Y1_9SPHN|nr:cell division protein ZapA [Sphingomicrobium sp. B8]
MSDIELTICGRPYQVRCRDGEEENLRAAGRLVDQKSREVIAGLGNLSEARQFFFAALLMADQMLNGEGNAVPVAAPASIDEAQVEAAEALAERLEAIANSLENASVSA